MLYNSSQLKKDIEDLKLYINKPEYQKIIDPYEKRILELERKIWKQEKDIRSLYMASQDFIESIKDNYLEIIINLAEPRAYISTFNNFEVQKNKIKKITIPIKENLKECFLNQISYYENKY